MSLESNANTSSREAALVRLVLVDGGGPIVVARRCVGRAVQREFKAEVTEEADQGDGAVDLDALSPAVQRAVAAFREELGS